METTDRNDPDLHKEKQNGQNEKYLVLSKEEIDKGFIRPYRSKYVHDACGVETTMNSVGICETYARDPKFYGATYCCGCNKHLPVEEFKWSDGQVVGS